MQDDTLSMSDTVKVIHTYQASNNSLNPVSSIMAAWHELFRARHVLWHLFLRDFLASFRQRILGYLWVVLLPLVSIASFVFMQLSGVLNVGHTDIPYPFYVYLGMTTWGLFISAATVVGNGLVQNADLVVRTNIPKIALAIMGLATVYYNLLVNLTILTLFLLLFGLVPSIWALLYPVIVLPIILLGIGIGLVLSVIGAIMRDAVTAFTTMFTLVMYITPVVYTAQFANPILNTIVKINPLTYLVDTPRRIFFIGEIPHIKGFIAATLFSFVILWLGIYVFYSLKDKVAERL